MYITGSCGTISGSNSFEDPGHGIRNLENMELQSAVRRDSGYSTKVLNKEGWVYFL